MNHVYFLYTNILWNNGCLQNKNMEWKFVATTNCNTAIEFPDGWNELLIVVTIGGEVSLNKWESATTYFAKEAKKQNIGYISVYGYGFTTPILFSVTTSNKNMVTPHSKTASESNYYAVYYR